MKMQERVRDVQKTGSFATSKFSALQNSTFFEVMSSTIYTNKVRAVIREISCNARDAQDDAGCLDKKFKVQLPTSLDATASFRDFGKGLDDHEVRGRYVCEECGHTEPADSDISDCCVCTNKLNFKPGIYNTYFLSTKRDKETAVGCLGLGTKSPFSLSDTFKVESFHDGRHRTYKCYMSAENAPDIMLLTDVETDEPSGLKVSLNVDSSDFYKFETEAINVFQFFDNVPEINKQEVYQQIEHRKAQYVINGDGYHFTGKTGQTYAVMGSVAYEIPSEYINLEGYIEFPLSDKDGFGTLKFNPGREYLSIDENTEKNLKDRISKVMSGLAYDMFKSIRALDGKFERAKKLDGLKLGIFGSLDSESKNRLNFFKMPLRKADPFLVFEQSGRYTQEDCPVGNLSNLRFFRVNEDKSIRGYTMRIREWSGWSYRNKAVLMTPTQIQETEIPESYLENLDALPEISRDTSYVRNTEKVFEFSYAGRYFNEGRDRNNHWKAVDIDLDDGEERLYVEISRYEPSERLDNNVLNQYIEAVEGLIGEGIKVYGVKSALAKQKRFKDSTFVNFVDWATEKVQEKISSKYYVQHGKADCNYLFLKLAKVIDNDMFTEFVMHKEVMDSQISKHVLRGLNIEIEEDEIVDSLYEEICSKYPLISHLNGANLDDVVEYLEVIDAKVSQ